MKLNDRIELARKMVEENPTSLSIAMPTHVLKLMLDFCDDRAAVKAENMKLAMSAMRYQRAWEQIRKKLDFLEEENQTLKKELRNYDGHSKTV